MNTLVLVDIDGVLNAVCNPESPPKIQSHWFSEWGNFTINRENTPDFFANSNSSVSEFTVSFSVELLEKLSTISKEQSAKNSENNVPTVSFKWLTTWKDFAHSIFCKKANFEEGLSWDVIKGDVASTSWWKFLVVKEMLDNDDSLHIVLLDDEVDSDENLDLFEELIGSTKRLTVINPNPSIGLTRAEVSFLESMLLNPKPGILSL